MQSFLRGSDHSCFTVFAAICGTIAELAAAAGALWHYKMCLFGTSWTSGAKAGHGVEGATYDDVDDDRSDERDLARRGRHRHDRNRRQAGQGLRAVRIPTLHQR